METSLRGNKWKYLIWEEKKTSKGHLSKESIEVIVISTKDIEKIGITLSKETRQRRKIIL